MVLAHGDRVQDFGDDGEIGRYRFERRVEKELRDQLGLTIDDRQIHRCARCLPINPGKVN